jgi:ABC-type Fe3+ transport system permease subunit
MTALAGFGLWTSASVATRSRTDWHEPRARGAIVASLSQALVTALLSATIGFVLAGWWIDLLTPGQSILVWLCYGLILGGGLQGVIAIAAIAFLLTGIELPDIED